MSEAKHTPLPWTFQENRSGMISNDVIGSDRNTVACYVGSANAAFIVKACNSHYELLQILRSVLLEPNVSEQFKSYVETAIAKAEGAEITSEEMK